MRVFASHTSDSEVRKQSSSGGVFTMLANKVLRNGGVVYGAAFTDTWSVAHIRVDNILDMDKLRGSKYVFSNVGKSIPQIADDLDTGRKVLFSGTSCQIAAVRKRFGNHPQLLLVEVVCHGVPPVKYWNQYLPELCKSCGHTVDQITEIKFRDKRIGWKNFSFTVEFSDGEIYTQPHNNNLYMMAFLKNIALREACYRCPFKLPQGCGADITIGDFWGIEKISPEIDNDLGTTIVIVHTEAGEKAVAALPVVSEPSFDDVKHYNAALSQPPYKHRKRELFLSAVEGCESITKVFRKYAKESWGEILYLKLGELKGKTYNFLKNRFR